MAFCVNEGTPKAIMDALSRLVVYPVGYANIKVIDRINYDEMNFTVTLNLYVSKEARESDPDRCTHYCIGGTFDALPDNEDIRSFVYAQIAQLLETQA